MRWQAFEFDRMDAVLYPSDKKPQRLWLLVSRRGATTLYTYDGLDIFMGAGNTEIDKFQRYWFCIKPGEETAVVVSSTDRKNKKAAFIQAAVNYFKDDADLVKKIQSEQYKWNDMEAIVDEYNTWKKNNH